MVKILNRFDVNNALIDIIENANKEIILISPYIKLNQAIKNALQKHRDNKNFALTVVYGKNDEDNRLSLSEQDLEFFKTFPNVEIRYHRRLHAKLYANDFDCLITSMNLHSYSMDENIEIGVLVRMNLISDLTSIFSAKNSNSLESQTRDFAQYVIEKSELHFSKYVYKEKRFFGLITSYNEPIIQTEKKRSGFCIRTKNSLPYNPQHPYSNDAYNSWKKWKNENYIEKYCHGCGKETSSSMAKPLCKECWKVS